MELYYSCAIPNRKSICISTLTDEQLSQCGGFEPFEGIGYYLYERDILDGEEEIEILARLETDESAEKMARFLCSIESVVGRVSNYMFAASIPSTGAIQSASAQR